MKYFRDCKTEHNIELNDHVEHTFFVQNVHQLSDFLELDAIDLQKMGLEKERKGIAKLIKAINDQALLDEKTKALQAALKKATRLAFLQDHHESISAQASERSSAQDQLNQA